MIHFLYLVGFALFAAIAFGVFTNGDSKEKFIYGLKIFAQFILISLVLAWIFYFLPWQIEMGLIETEGLILKSYSLAEADKIVVLLTQDEGLVRGVAKGAKRLKSRFGGGLEPFSIVQI